MAWSATVARMNVVGQVDPAPLSVQLAIVLREIIELGELGPGAPLPVTLTKLCYRDGLNSSQTVALVLVAMTQARSPSWHSTALSWCSRAWRLPPSGGTADPVRDLPRWRSAPTAGPPASGEAAQLHYCFARAKANEQQKTGTRPS